MSFIPPNITPPDPPEARAVALVLTIIMTLLMIVFVGLVCIDFLADMAGYPLHFTGQAPVQDWEPIQEQDVVNEFKAPFELITPKHHTGMLGPEIRVIYTRRLPVHSTMPPDLIIDTAPHPWETQFGDNTWLARLQLPAGVHRVRVEESEAEFFVETLDSTEQLPEEWTWNKPHNGTDKIDQCRDCHAVSDPPRNSEGNGKTIGIWKGAASCFTCHDEVDHEFRHAIIQPATQCLRCHTIH